MASKTDKLNLVISLKEVKKTGTSIAGLGKKLISLKGIIAASFATAAIVKFTKASNIQEAAVTSLNAALKNTGIYSAALSNELQTLASDLQKVTTEGDEATLANQALMINLGKLSADVIPKATKAAIGLSRKMGVDARTAFMLLGRAAQGATQMFSRYGIQLDMSMTDQERFTEILKIGNEAFSLATDEAKSGAGQMKQFGNTVGDLQEAFGDLVKLGLVPLLPHLIEFIEYVSDAVKILNSWIGVTAEMSRTTEIYVKLAELWADIERYEKGGYFYLERYNEAMAEYAALYKTLNLELEKEAAIKKESIITGETELAQIEKINLEKAKSHVWLTEHTREYKIIKKLLEEMYDIQDKEINETIESWMRFGNTMSSILTQAAFAHENFFKAVFRGWQRLLIAMVIEAASKAAILAILKLAGVDVGTWASIGKGIKSIFEFQAGGYTGDIGGIVHKHEYVIPDWMVAGMPGTIAGLEAVRAGGGSRRFKCY